MNAFLELDKINYTNLNESLIDDKKKNFVSPVLAFLDKNILIAQSSKVVKGIHPSLFV